MRTVCRIGIIRRIKGSISIFLLIVLLPALVFSGLMADISRHHLAKAAAEEAGRLTLNSVLADYDTILKDVYGLFAISQQPGLSDDERRELLMDHFRINLENVGMFAPVLEDLQISPVPESSLANPEIIEKGILEFMKYRAPAETALSLVDSLAVLARIGDQSRVAEQKMNVELKLKEVTADCAELYRIIAAYDAHTRQYKSAEQQLIASITDIKGCPETESEEYAEKYDRLQGYFHNWKELSPIEFADYAISTGEKLLRELEAVGQEKENFSICVEEYGAACGDRKADAFYTAMRQDDSRYDSSFGPEQVEELLSQLRAAKNFLSMRNFETVEEVIASLNDHTASGNASNINRYYRSGDSYLKSIGEVLRIGDKVIGIPDFHIYLMSAYGSDTGASDPEYGNGKGLSKSIRSLSDQAKEQASVEEAYSYSMKLFQDVPSGIYDGKPSTFEDIGEDSDYGAISQYRNMSSAVTNLLSALEKGIRDIRNNLYISEYVRHNFSCLTSGADEVTLTGIPIDPERNRIYGCEVEYIVFGNKGCNEKKFLWFTVREEAGPESNLATAKTSILAIRFVCNSVYALTDSEIDHITLAPALAIQAASGGVFPYQLAQLTMKLALALAESCVDLEELLRGEKVPMLKSRATWRCSAQGILDFLKDRVSVEISEAVHKGVQKGVGFLQRCVDDTADHVAGSVSEYLDGLSTDLETAITATIEQTVSSLLMSLREKAVSGFADIFEIGSFDREDFIRSCMEEIAKFCEGIEKETADALTDIIPVLENDVIKHFADILADVACEAAAKAEGEDVIYVLEEAMCSRITAELAGCVSSFTEKAEEIINSEVNKIIKSASDELKGSIVDYGDRISKMATEKLTAKAIEILDRYIPASKYVHLPAEDMDIIGGDPSGLKLGSLGETIICLSYSDYLQIFLLLKLSGSKREEVLLRIADVIQLNVAMQHESKSGFRMSKAYTYAEIKATFRTPSFLLPVKFDAMAEEYHDFAGY